MNKAINLFVLITIFFFACKTKPKQTWKDLKMDCDVSFSYGAFTGSDYTMKFFYKENRLIVMKSSQSSTRLTVTDTIALPLHFCDTLRQNIDSILAYDKEQFHHIGAEDGLSISLWIKRPDSTQFISYDGIGNHEDFRKNNPYTYQLLQKLKQFEIH